MFFQMKAMDWWLPCELGKSFWGHYFRLLEDTLGTRVCYGYCYRCVTFCEYKISLLCLWGCLVIELLFYYFLFLMRLKTIWSKLEMARIMHFAIFTYNRFSKSAQSSISQKLRGERDMEWRVKYSSSVHISLLILLPQCHPHPTNYNKLLQI